MAVSIGTRLKRSLIRLGVGMMPYFPLPAEWYRKILVGDSEKRYATGRWAYMRDIAESHRYSLIIGCADYYKSPNRKVLDVGCGEGILQQRMVYLKYTGMDMNAEAIRLAQARADANTEFFLAAAESYQANDLYDVIVFNESLYYIKDPMVVFAKYRALLANDGIIIVCMFQTNLARRLWSHMADTGMAELTESRISNELGFASVVKVYSENTLEALPPGQR